jgi:hypothetical protein
MTDSRIPEGRKPLTDADIAALTRRLAGTAVDYKELYEAAKRDAEEAEAYAADLEEDRRKTYEALLLVSRLHSDLTSDEGGGRPADGAEHTSARCTAAQRLTTSASKMPSQN